MRKSFARVLIAAAAFGAGACTIVFASGSYSGRPPKPTSSGLGSRIDQDKWELGKLVYAGGVSPAGGGDLAVQAPRLQAAQASLPADVAKVKDLVALAGKISDAQLSALEYFLDRRFPTKK